MNGNGSERTLNICKTIKAFLLINSIEHRTTLLKMFVWLEIKSTWGYYNQSTKVINSLLFERNRLDSTLMITQSMLAIAST